MNAQRFGLRFGRTLRSPTFRSAPRRFESTSKFPEPGKKLVGLADNAFNRERAAVKAHAAATSGISAALKRATSSLTNQLNRPLAKTLALVRTSPRFYSPFFCQDTDNGQRRYTMLDTRFN
jgi:hypothetical protein